MATVLLLHHAQGLTPGVRSFAARLVGHDVITPDLYDGRTFDDLDEGVAYALQVGEDEIRRRGVAAGADLPDGAVVAGMSLGCAPAQQLAIHRPGIAGALLLFGGNASHWFGAPWPAAVPVQVHAAERDPWFEEAEVAALLAEAADGEVFRYPGDGHLIADDSLPAYDPAAADLVVARSLAFLDRVS